MQTAIREELMALRQIAEELNERLERLAHLVEAEEAQETAKPKLSLIEEFKQKHPNLPVPRLLRYAASQNPPPHPIEDYKQAIRDALPDFEDNIQAYCAAACQADYLVTRNVGDFVGSPVPAITPDDLLALLLPATP